MFSSRRSFDVCVSLQHLIVCLTSASKLTNLADIYLIGDFFWLKLCAMSIQVLHISQFDATKLSTSVPKRSQGGTLRIDLDYKDPALNGKHYLVQTPKLRLPFGMQQYNDKDQDNKNKSFSLSLSLDNYRDLNSHECEFLKGIKAIDDHIKALALENCNTWFRKSLKKEVIDELFSSSIRETADWPPTFRCKLPYYSGEFSCDFYDSSKKKCDSESITQNCHVIGLMNVTSIWFVANRFGISWQIKQIQVFQTPKYDTFLITGEEAKESDDSDRSRSRSPRGQTAIED